ncbi:glutamine amidotransferase [Corynebacterium alimapuense]|uniref:Glutamine amidotransferase n=1 Tax=Corynebacterium alimapuense TaxID=1576874 RepID=A0A3M8K7H7_9CORY|nr:glutamine amidotransferase [Corynebacterium alimapuense]RNE49173.1 glutamine amidotransferase [Corynebacterium alimapuense]
MPKVLFVSLRSGELADQVSTAEYRDFIQTTGLTFPELPMIVLSSTERSVGNLSDYDGVIVGGSSLNITNEPWDDWQHHIHQQLSEIIESGLPTFLVCYGASWLAHTVGGTIGHQFAEQSGPTYVELTDAGRTDPISAGLPDSFTSLTGHTECIEAISPELTVLASGPSCPVQFLRYREHVWATQFHSDMDAAAMHDRMNFYRDYGYFSPEDYDTIVAGLPQVDTTWSNQLMRNFVDYCDRRQLSFR